MKTVPNDQPGNTPRGAVHHNWSFVGGRITFWRLIPLRWRYRYVLARGMRRELRAFRARPPHEQVRALRAKESFEDQLWLGRRA